MTRLTHKKRYPAKLINRAREVLRRFDAGTASPKRIDFHRLEGELYKLDVGMRYRLLTQDKVTWWLVSHECYNRFLNH